MGDADIVGGTDIVLDYSITLNDMSAPHSLGFFY